MLEAKINSFDPPLLSIRPSYASEPLTMFSDPPIERASRRPADGLNLNRGIYFPPIRFAILTWVEIVHTRLEHTSYSGERTDALSLTRPHSRSRGPQLLGRPSGTLTLDQQLPA
jgi:hypothetical protein